MLEVIAFVCDNRAINKTRPYNFTVFLMVSFNQTTFTQLLLLVVVSKSQPAPFPAAYCKI